ncbi:MAG TPA: hypothetical protein VHD90_19660 [Phototrophicaceae bacterium]|nr:hypothetical protein [Phototrophicaceae bacterium]
MRLSSQFSHHHAARWSWRRLGCFVLALPIVVVLVFLLFVTVCSPPVSAAVSVAPLPADFQRGVSYVSDKRGDFSHLLSDQTLAQIVAPSSANWVAVIVTCYQQNDSTTEISCAHASASDDDLRHVITQAHSLGLKVMLKPHVDPLDMPNSSNGRFNINFGSDETAWTAWFASYTRFITHYAALAQELHAEYFTVGTELGDTVTHADQWRSVIRAVRAVYSGPLTYAALTYVEPLEISWWDQLDAIGIDAYFAVTLTKNPTPAQMELGWSPTVAFLGEIAQHWNKPIILTEVGYMSVDGTNILPGDWSLDGATDPQEQADSYQALFEAFGGQSWWRGVFWWALSTDPDQGGLTDRGYSFHGKPAEAVLKRFFGAAAS